MKNKLSPYSLEEVIEFRRKEFEAQVDILKRKGSDYNRAQQKDGDTLFNLKVAEICGIVSTAEQGILCRLGDKFMRLISLAGLPDINPDVSNESVRDTVRDIHNYVDYLLIMYLDRRGEFRPLTVTEGLTSRSLTPAEAYIEDGLNR